MRRVSYYQSLFDLLEIQPGRSSDALHMIAEHEAAHGPLPAAVRDWYSTENVVGLWPVEGEHHDQRMLWYEYSNEDHPQRLSVVLAGFAATPSSLEPFRVRVLVE